MDQRRKLDSTYAAEICPQCREPIAGSGYGTGKIADGRFCSLTCYASFYDRRLRDKARRTATTFPAG